jgi:hypothetical protein
MKSFKQDSNIHNLLIDLSQEIEAFSRCFEFGRNIYYQELKYKYIIDQAIDDLIIHIEQLAQWYKQIVMPNHNSDPFDIEKLNTLDISLEKTLENIFNHVNGKDMKALHLIEFTGLINQLQIITHQLKRNAVEPITSFDEKLN